VLLSDGYLANSAEPWAIPDMQALEPISIGHPTAIGLNGAGFLPFARDAETLARPWALPGTPGLEHRIGGLSKQPGTGNVSYDPSDTQQMNDERRAKVAALADWLPEQDVFGPESGKLLVLGWGGTYGALRQAVTPTCAT
jgi:2-oxoglutarate ferredoxin oxidoreductase subunit alpha